jgi:hypothetical protein
VQYPSFTLPNSNRVPELLTDASAGPGNGSNEKCRAGSVIPRGIFVGGVSPRFLSS